MPTLSVLVPTFNRAASLRLTLPHMIREAEATRGEVEVVVGDNASSDETPNVVEALAPRRLRHERNLGSWRNIVELAAAARGEWLWVIGDDDYLVPGALAALVSRLAARTDEEDVVFVNHGWVQAARLVEALERGERLAPSGDRQWNVDTDVELACGMQVFELASGFAAGAFNAIFGFVVRRRAFLEHARDVVPGELDDGFNDGRFDLEDAFPHSIVGLAIARRSRAFVCHEVAVLQGVGAWHSRRYLYRTVIIGLTWLFQRFAADIPPRAWQSLADYAGKRSARMLKDPEANAGFADVERESAALLLRWPEFLSSFSSECARTFDDERWRASYERWAALGP